MSTVEAPAERKTKRAHRSPNGPGLYITDAELIELLGVPEDIARVTIHNFDTKHTGFPKKQAMFGGRRYWPAVRVFLDNLNGVRGDQMSEKAHDAKLRDDRTQRHATVRIGK